VRPSHPAVSPTHRNGQTVPRRRPCRPRRAGAPRYRSRRTGRRSASRFGRRPESFEQRVERVRGQRDVVPAERQDDRVDLQRAAASVAPAAASMGMRPAGDDQGGRGCRAAGQGPAGRATALAGVNQRRSRTASSASASGSPSADLQSRPHPGSATCSGVPRIEPGDDRTGARCAIRRDGRRRGDWAGRVGRRGSSTRSAARTGSGGRGGVVDAAGRSPRRDWSRATSNAPRLHASFTQLWILRKRGIGRWPVLMRSASCVAVADHPSAGSPPDNNVSGHDN